MGELYPCQSPAIIPGRAVYNLGAKTHGPPFAFYRRFLEYANLDAMLADYFLNTEKQEEVEKRLRWVLAGLLWDASNH